jgi:ATP-dependent DNA ligase
MRECRPLNPPVRDLMLGIFEPKYDGYRIRVRN